MQFRLRTLLIVLAIGPPVLASVYLAPGPMFAFLVIVGSCCCVFLEPSNCVTPKPNRRTGSRTTNDQQLGNG
jgi:hypothetical protein